MIGERSEIERHESSSETTVNVPFSSRLHAVMQAVAGRECVCQGGQGKMRNAFVVAMR